MSREIKFRGKRVDNGEWVYGDVIHYRNKEVKILEQNEGLWDILHDGFEVTPESVGQFTGLKDKNEVDIYEGDILGHIETDKGWHTTQEYKKMDVISCDGYNRWTTLWSFYKYEIIGNIYENPELLEGNNE